MEDRSRCVECGDELSPERVELGYRYCTRSACQAVRHRGLAITTVAVNKSADSFVVADADEVRRRGEAGEFGRKDAGLGLDYRRSAAARGTATSGARSTRPPPARPGRRSWTPAQEQAVRLYHGMGLSPRQIAERARQNTPRLGVTEQLAVRILSTLPRR